MASFERHSMSEPDSICLAVTHANAYANTDAECIAIGESVTGLHARRRVAWAVVERADGTAGTVSRRSGIGRCRQCVHIRRRDVDGDVPERSVAV